MSRQAKRLRELFKGAGIVRIMGAHDALGAKLVEKAGFDGVWASGLEISTAHAVPDANILTMSEFLDASESMADAVHIPVVSDCDTGFGNSNNVIRMVGKYEAAGVAAVCIEDKLFPKVNSFVPGRQELAPIAEFVGKIMAAKNAQRSPEFMVIARVEALIAGWTQEEAIRRAHAYQEAGADAILIHSKSKTPQQIMDFIKAWDFSAPLVLVPTTYPSVTAQQWQNLGVKMVIYANHGMRASINAMLQTYEEILRSGSTAASEEKIAPMSLVFDLQGFPQFKRDEAIYVRTGVKRTRAIIPAAGDHLDEYSMKQIASDIPMAMLDLNGKPLLQRQVESLNVSGVRDVTVVGGYKHEKIQLDGIKLAVNPDWKETGEAESIFRGDSDYDGFTLVVYSDILFDSEVVGKLLKTDADITLLVDRSYSSKNYGASRRIDLVKVANPRPDSRRALNIGAVNQVRRIGKNLPPDEANCEFAGLALFSTKGFALLRQVYEAESGSSAGGYFHEAKSKRSASLTDLVQELIDQGYEVDCVEVSSGWMEVHSFDNYRLACQMVSV
jgi:phosphoenolpyruvate phosphomutase